MLVRLDLNVRNVLLLLIVLLRVLLLTHRPRTRVGLSSVKTLLLNELRVEEHQSLVHHLQRRGHLLVVLIELSNYVLSTLAWEFNEQGLGRFHVVGCYK